MLKWLERRHCFLLAVATASSSWGSRLLDTRRCLPADDLFEEMRSTDPPLGIGRDELCFQAYGALKTGVFWLERPRVSRALHWQREEGKGGSVLGVFGAGPQRILLLCSSACYLYEIPSCLIIPLLPSCLLLKQCVGLRVCSTSCEGQSFSVFQNAVLSHLLRTEEWIGS